MSPTCPMCSHLFETGDSVRAVITTRFKARQSKIVYALEKPDECLEVRHVNCQLPKGADLE